MKIQEAPTAGSMLHDVLGQLAAEVAEPLTRALERVRALAAGETLDARQLQALHDEVARARRIGILGQQIARLASGGVRQVPEPTDLCAMLDELLDEHRRDAAPGAREVRATLGPAAVVTDTGLTGALLRALLEWCDDSALTPIELRLDARPSSAQANLLCRFTRKPRAPGTAEPLSWQLMHFAAAALSARLTLEEDHASTTLSLQFERLVALAGHAEPSASDARLLAGCQLLVLAPDRDMRNQVRLAVQGLDLLVDYVASVDAACDYCADGLPQAVVYASTLSGAPLERLRRRLHSEVGAPPFIEITPQGHGFEPLRPGDEAVARVGLDGLAQALPAALVIELTRRR
ncbi:hypothetical protein HLB44_03915 [Aquincola sp. S2]|uniref:Uncharacterized protein n=1 Tax=Pseudaquabacterium terrae TaxID=2732868 RepID=A0ABX2EB64_9BURK|nr:hypothetical protein [Aquabacterium terrae]NRF66120.1 hypothetical protein [Aquabacterium terrae]